MNRRAFWVRRGAHLVLVGGAALSVMLLLDPMPREQVLVFPKPPHPITALNVHFWDEAGDEVRGLTLNFPGGRSLPLRHILDLPNGEYEVHTRLEFLPSAGATQPPRTKTNRKHRVTLRGGETPILF